MNKEYCGLAGNRGRNEQEIIGETFTRNYVDATSLERNKYNIKGDKAEVFYTDILQKYKFCEIDGENFMTEATVWERMAYDGYKIRWFNEIIYICDYLEDGLTKNLTKTFSNNPRGTALYIKQQIKFYNYNLKGRLANYHLYYTFVKSNINLKQAAEFLEVKPATLRTAVFIFESKNLILSRLK